MQYVSTTYGCRLPHRCSAEESAFNIRLNIGYGDSYIEALKQLKADGTISDAQFKALRTNLYYPGSVPVDDHLQQIQQSLQQQTLTSFIGKNGLPAIGSPMFRQIYSMLGEMACIVINLKRQLHHWIRRYRNSFLAAMGNPANVPAHLQMLFNQVNSKAIRKTIETIGLPAAMGTDRILD